jgi:hypothetical protein
MGKGQTKDKNRTVEEWELDSRKDGNGKEEDRKRTEEVWAC